MSEIRGNMGCRVGERGRSLREKNLRGGAASREEGTGSFSGGGRIPSFCHATGSYRMLSAVGSFSTGASGGGVDEESGSASGRGAEGTGRMYPEMSKPSAGDLRGRISRKCSSEKTLSGAASPYS